MDNQMQVESSAGSERKAYHAPRVENYGVVGKLTQTTFLISAQLDGGPTFPFMYSSAP